jgi:site-specific DNA-methyltransferase (adenine-specific)
LTVDKAPFSLQGRNPDVLTSIANLSSDVVFTPPDVANRMLDSLELAWSSANEGSSIWANSEIRFLDPFSKSGVFLREISKRLIKGLEPQIPDLQERVNHVLARQVFGIAITELSALISRRSLYCSKVANSPHSVCTIFDNEQGNLIFDKTEHTWRGGRNRLITADEHGNEVEEFTDAKCIYCGANKRDYDRQSMESYAYPFLHTDNPKKLIREKFGDEMKFDVVIGNPPYQLGQSGGESVGGFAMPIYQKFIQSAKGLEPRYISMITPSRWFAGGRGLDEFRAEMLSDRRLRALCDYPNAKEVFPGTQIEGGVSYFLWDATWNGQCSVQSFEQGKATTEPLPRYLDAWDVHVRRNEAVPILEKVQSEASANANLASQVRPIQPFGLRTNFVGIQHHENLENPLMLFKNGGTAFVEAEVITKNRDLIPKWKVLLGAAYGAGSTTPIQVYNIPIIAPPNSVCTETYLVIGVFDSEEEARNFAHYLATKFVRFLVSLKKNTQHLYSERFSFVPSLPMDTIWTDELLNKKFKLSPAEVSYIDSMIRPMEANFG